jgi:hypothetical protein
MIKGVAIKVENMVSTILSNADTGRMPMKNEDVGLKRYMKIKLPSI